MPAVFVHGVPDTSEMWDPLLAKLSRSDIVALRLPGFGEPVPSGFGCTMNDYAAWLEDTLVHRLRESNDHERSHSLAEKTFVHRPW